MLAAVTLPSGEKVQVEYAVPTAEGCTVEPLSVDQVMAKLKNHSDLDYVSPDGTMPPPQLDETTYSVVADAQRQWLACSIFGSPFQRWALETNQVVRDDFLVRYMPHFDMREIRTNLEDAANDEVPTSFTLAPDLEGGFLPMVPTTFVNGLYNRASTPADVTITIFWMSQNGTVLRSSAESEDALEPYMAASMLEKSLPNAWSHERPRLRTLAPGRGELG